MKRLRFWRKKQMHCPETNAWWMQGQGLATSLLTMIRLKCNICSQWTGSGRRWSLCEANFGNKKERKFISLSAPEGFHTNLSHCLRLAPLPHCEHPRLPAFDWRLPDPGTVLVPWSETSWPLKSHELQTSFLQSLLPELPLPCCTPSELVAEYVQSKH